MSASIWGESLTILENAAILKELVEKLQCLLVKNLKIHEEI